MKELCARNVLPFGVCERAECIRPEENTPTNHFHCYHCEIPSVCHVCFAGGKSEKMAPNVFNLHELRTQNARRRPAKKTGNLLPAAIPKPIMGREKIAVLVRTVHRLHMFEIMERTIEQGIM